MNRAPKCVVIKYCLWTESVSDSFMVKKLADRDKFRDSHTRKKTTEKTFASLRNRTIVIRSLTHPHFIMVLLEIFAV